MNNQQKLDAILKHLKMVESNTQALAKKLIDTNKSFALKLVAAGRKHDLSKLNDFEFDNLNDDAPADVFDAALKMHRKRNSHHPEYHNSIHDMSELNIAEMVCDCVARGQEFGTDSRVWFSKSATKKYGFKMSDPAGKLITKYLNLLLTPVFKNKK